MPDKKGSFLPAAEAKQASITEFSRRISSFFALSSGKKFYIMIIYEKDEQNGSGKPYRHFSKESKNSVLAFCPKTETGEHSLTIEQIDDNKIKVTVSEKDQAEFGVTYESMNYSDANTRRLCEKIMHRAGKEIGFRTGGAKLLVEARQTGNGNVTLYLSRIEPKAEEEKRFSGIAAFEDMNGVMDCCKIFEGFLPSLKANSLYRLNGKYYLYFEIIQKRKNAEQLWKTILEFGEKANMGKGFLSEHGECLCPKEFIEKMSGAKRL